MAPGEDTQGPFAFLVCRTSAARLEVEPDGSEIEKFAIRSTP
jgi:hypothetical protein